MKSPITLLLVVLLTLALIALSLTINGSAKLKDEVERQAQNFDQLGRQYSTLTLSKWEVERELDKRNRTLVAADSILKAKDKRISQLEKIIATGITVVDTDTVYVDTPVFIPLPEKGMFKTEFTQTKSCITVSGFILSTDSVPSIAITERKAELEVYDIRIKRRWWELWKPKYERYIETTCGEAKIIEIEKMK